MPDTMPRWMLALAGIVAVLTIALGIKDYVQKPKDYVQKPITSTPNLVQSNPKAARKKSISAKTTQARMSASKANALETTQAERC